MIIRNETRVFLASLFHAAVRAASPHEVLKGHLPDPPKGRAVVVRAGKGAAQLARASEDLWPHACEGVVVTRYGYGCETRRVRVIEVAHPVPDAAGQKASRALLAAVGVTSPPTFIQLQGNSGFEFCLLGRVAP